MSEENTVETPETVAPVETVETDPIADIVKKYGIEEQATQFKETVAPEPKPVVTETRSPVPEPYDSENFKRYMEQQEQGTTALRQQYQTLAQVIGTLTAREASAKLETDIKEAVKTVDEIANLGKPKLVEAFLDSKVREDSRLKTIWDNRQRNPKALQEALKVIGKEIAEEFSVRTDPKLVEAQRARKAAQSTTQTTKDDSPDEKVQAQIDKAGGFERFWENLKGSMN